MLARRRPALAISLVAVSVAAVCAAAAWGAMRAAATWVAVPETGEPGLLSLMTDNTEPWVMSPGEPVHWQVRVSLDEPAGTLELMLVRDGPLTYRYDGLQVLVRQCSVEWIVSPDADPVCPTGAVGIIGPVALADDMFGEFADDPTALHDRPPAWSLGVITNTSAEWFMVSVSLPGTDEVRRDTSLMGLEAVLGLGFRSEFAEVPPPTSPSHPPMPGEPSPSPSVPPAGPGSPGFADDQDQAAETGSDRDRLADTGASIAVMLLLAGGVVGIVTGVRLARGRT